MKFQQNGPSQYWQTGIQTIKLAILLAFPWIIAIIFILFFYNYQFKFLHCLLHLSVWNSFSRQILGTILMRFARSLVGPHDLQQPALFWLLSSAGPFLVACSVFYPPNLPAIACFFRSSADIEFWRFIRALVISRNDSSTPVPNLALVFITLRLCVCSKLAISSSVTSISRSWSSSSSSSW